MLNRGEREFLRLSRTLERRDHDEDREAAPELAKQARALAEALK